MQPIDVLEKERQKFSEEIATKQDDESTSTLNKKWREILADTDARNHIQAISKVCFQFFRNNKRQFQDPKNFLEDPPIEVSDALEFIKFEGVANELLKLDPNLAEIRFSLVPKQ